MIQVKINATQGASLWEVEDETHIKPKGERLVRIAHVDQEGKGWSTNDYDDTAKALVETIPALTEKVDLIDDTGLGDNYLSDDGTYKPVSGGKYYPYPIDEPSAEPSEWDDEFDGDELDEKWVIDENLSTIYGDKFLLKLWPGTDQSGITAQEAPTGNFMMITKVSLHAPSINYLRAGLALYNNGKRIIYGARFNDNVQGIAGVRCPSGTSWSSDLPTTIVFSPYYYLKIKCDGGNLTFSWSLDGYYWYTSNTETVASYLGALTHIGVGFFRNNNDGTNYGATFDFFRVEELE